jgi:PAS domain S-box-containing protein
MSAVLQIADRPPRILIVDDERHNRQLLQVMLAPEGFQLLTAANGQEALKIVARQPPDVILLDVMMQGTSGYQVADKIKSNAATKNIPIIMVTALDDRESRMQALGAGAEDFLTKPVDRAELCMRVRNLSRLKSYGDYFEQQAALLSEQAALLDLTQDAVVVQDLQGLVLFWSRGAETLYGWPRAEALGKNASELLRAEFLEPDRRPEDALLTDGRWEGEATHRTRKGERLVVASRWALQRDAAGQPARVLTINSDITDRKGFEDAMKASEETFRAAMEHASIGMALVEPRGRWLKVNNAMCEMLGYSATELLDTDFQSITHPDDLKNNLELGRQLFAGTIQTYQIEKRYLRKDGHLIWCLLNVSLVRNANGSPRYFVSQIQDITARKEVDRIKSELIATISHELRTPLTAIRGSLGLVNGGAAGALPEKAAQLVEVAYRNTDRLMRIIDDILDVEKLDSGKASLELSIQPLAPLVEQAVEENRGYAQSYQVNFVVHTMFPDILVRVDPNRLLQVLANLLSNAAKFSPVAAAVEIRMSREGANVRVSVTDRGPGIPLAFRKRIFERFSQADGSDSRQKGGTGLGLTISKALIEQMGGTIGYETHPGIATAFFFDLPALTSADAAAL